MSQFHMAKFISTFALGLCMILLCTHTSVADDDDDLDDSIQDIMRHPIAFINKMKAARADLRAKQQKLTDDLLDLDDKRQQLEDDQKQNAADRTKNAVDAAVNKVNANQNAKDAAKNQADADQNQKVADQNQKDKDQNDKIAAQNAKDAAKNAADAAQNQKDAAKNKADADQNQKDKDKNDQDAIINAAERRKLGEGLVQLAKDQDAVKKQKADLDAANQKLKNDQDKLAQDQKKLGQDQAKLKSEETKDKDEEDKLGKEKTDLDSKDKAVKDAQAKLDKDEKALQDGQKTLAADQKKLAGGQNQLKKSRDDFEAEKLKYEADLKKCQDLLYPKPPPMVPDNTNVPPCKDHAGLEFCSREFPSVGGVSYCINNVIFGKWQCCATCAQNMGAPPLGLNDPNLNPLMHPSNCKDGIAPNGKSYTPWCQKIRGNPSTSLFHCDLPVVLEKCTKTCGLC